MELFDEVLQIVKNQDNNMQEIAKRIVDKAKNSIIEAAKERKDWADIDISEENLQISSDLKKHLQNAGLRGFKLDLYSTNPWTNHGPATHLRVMIPPPNAKKETEKKPQKNPRS